MQEAAKSLEVGLSVMKRVCRTLGLVRWPYRSRSSLRSVIEKTEMYLVMFVQSLSCVTSAMLVIPHCCVIADKVSLLCR